MTMQTTASVLALADATARVAAKMKQVIRDVSSGDLDPAKIKQTIETAAGIAVQSVLAEVNQLDATELMRVTDEQREVTEIQNTLSPKLKFGFEFFHPKYSLAAILSVGGVETVAGDDSIDLEDSSDLEIGQEYIIQSGMVHETVVVKEILTATRIRCFSPLANSMTGGTLTKTNWTYISSIQNEGESTKATAETGQVYYSGVINVDSAIILDKTKSILIRINDSAEIPTFYFRNSGTLEWTEAVWNWDRPVYNKDMKDIEYNFDIDGDFEIKVVANGITIFDYIMVLTSPSELQRGSHHPPEIPVMGLPAHESVDIGEQPALTIADYVSATGTALKGVTFQVSAVAGNFETENLVVNTGVVAGYSYTPVKGVLQSNTTYYVRAKVTDTYDTTSEWSAATSFTTKAVFVSIDAPTGTTPAAGTELSSPDNLTLVSSDFAYTGDADTHAASQWQMATDALFANIILDSNEDAVNLTSYNVPDGTVERGGAYFWRIRHKGGTSGEWSDWSASIEFSVLAFSHGLRVDGGIALGPYTFADGENGWLIVAPASERATSLRFGLYGTDVAGVDNISDLAVADSHSGTENHAILVSATYNTVDDGKGSVGCPAAEYCDDLSFEGFSDYFLPNKDELYSIYSNKALIDSADDTTGTTLASIGSTYVWSSTESSTVSAFKINMSGAKLTGSKSFSSPVIPCRREV